MAWPLPYASVGLRFYQQLPFARSVTQLDVADLGILSSMVCSIVSCVLLSSFFGRFGSEDGFSGISCFEPAPSSLTLPLPFSEAAALLSADLVVGIVLDIC